MVLNQGDKVKVTHSPHYGIATVETGNICPVTGQVTVSFADDWGFHYFYPENLVVEAATEQSVAAELLPSTRG